MWKDSFNYLHSHLHDVSNVLHGQLYCLYSPEKWALVSTIRATVRNHVKKFEYQNYRKINVKDSMSTA